MAPFIIRVPFSLLFGFNKGIRKYKGQKGTTQEPSIAVLGLGYISNIIPLLSKSALLLIPTTVHTCGQESPSILPNFYKEAVLWSRKR